VTVCYAEKATFSIISSQFSFGVCAPTIVDVTPLDSGVTKSTVGFANGGGGTVTFDDCGWYVPWVTARGARARNCPKCHCYCYKEVVGGEDQISCIPTTATLTIYNVANCACADGQVVTLTQRTAGLKIYWDGSYTCSGCDIPRFVTFTLTCTPGGIGDITLNYSLVCDNVYWTILNSGRPRSTSTCEPGLLIFDVSAGSASGGLPQDCCDGTVSPPETPRTLRIEVTW